MHQYNTLKLEHLNSYIVHSIVIIAAAYFLCRDVFLLCSIKTADFAFGTVCFVFWAKPENAVI